jgi:hypothetical protein
MSLILFAFIMLIILAVAVAFQKPVLYKVSGVIPAENRRVTFFESEDYDDAMVVSYFGWKGRGLVDITIDRGKSELPIDEHGRRSVANQYWAKET